MEECRESRVTEEQAEELIMQFLEANQIDKLQCPLAGNSIYMDRMFLRIYMQRVDNHLHHRIIDVSSLKELCKRWNPDIFASLPAKRLIHRGLDDIKDSIQEARYYKKYMFLPTA